MADVSQPYSMFTADAVPASNLFWIIDCWEMVRRKMKAEGAVEYILVIDEVQKIDSWSEAVKKEWDADTFNGLNIKVVLLGSSRVIRVWASSVSSSRTRKPSLSVKVVSKQRNSYR